MKKLKSYALTEVLQGVENKHWFEFLILQKYLKNAIIGQFLVYI